MNKKTFQNPAKIYSVVMFIQEDTLKAMRQEIEDLGKQKNVLLVVQPCPYEGIEFLYQVEFNFPGSIVSQEKEFFWLSLEFKGSLTKAQVQEISDHHYQYLVSILQNDTKQVEKERKILESLIQKNS
jgi:hypothetical protein